MDLRLDDKVAIVTGGSRGIGKGIALEYAKAGAQVMIVSRKAEVCEAAAEEIGHGCRWMAGNAGDEVFVADVVSTVMADFGRADIMVNNAGTNPYAGPTIDIDLPRWNKTWHVNVTAPLMWSKAVWDAHIKESDGGCSVVNISSVGGFATNPIIGAYDVTKAALIHLTKQLAAEMGPKANVNAICPGLVKTDFARVLWEGDRGDQVAQAYPMKRLGEAFDMAAMAVLLASEAGSWLTGQAIVIDGGGLVSFSKIG
ncbi:MAG: SDR family oxidoreductase [Actinomycetia bacterium]|nr:SDR family oxidoreductase [Actinomycetes bacterium]MCP4957654.1 SDR family oxidoreductase [Actinomycetes bacterium]